MIFSPVCSCGGGVEKGGSGGESVGLYRRAVEARVGL